MIKFKKSSTEKRGVILQGDINGFDLTIDDNDLETLKTGEFKPDNLIMNGLFDSFGVSHQK